ncbi:MAG: histidine kinase N-terminal domain-containing protein [Coriobacteriia bacterium]|nr:histidine kinase N-terminal domain-containing protein [Coriobacteriia bacterium]
MSTPSSARAPLSGLAPAERDHITNVAANLQLAADLGYGDVALLVAAEGGDLRVFADARPMTAAAAVPVTRVGESVVRTDEPEAYDALEGGVVACGTHRRIRRGIAFTSTGYPIGPAEHPYAVVVRHVGQSVAEAPGKMEVAFMRLAALVLERLQTAPITDLDADAPYSTTRLAGDGVIEVAESGAVTYASPNAVNIMRLAGTEGTLVGSPASALPGGASTVTPVLGTGAAREMTLEVRGRSLRYRTIALAEGALVLVEDVTDARRREQELRVKEATIREVHHRVKNNLQTIASLLRIQARRSSTTEAALALGEAVERVSSMAVVHEMLAESAEESVDLSAVVRTVVEMVGRSLIGPGADIRLVVEGETGLVPAPVATSLALVAVELVHNAIQHGIGASGSGSVTVTMRGTASEVSLTVKDTGRGLPDGFSVSASANLGLAIVRTIVEDDLRGTLSFGTAAGTLVSVRVPVPERT